MVDVLIVGGFLGAGKTTWLANYLARQSQRSTTVIVNEFASTDVDGTTLGDIDVTAQLRESVSIVGGCICCERLDELRLALHAVVTTIHRLGADADHGSGDLVVIETTGLADPAPLIELLNSDRLLAVNMVLREVVVVVDAIDGIRHLQHRRLARRQVQAAGRVVVAKADLVDAEQLDVVAGTVLRINPGVPVTAAADGIESDLVVTDPGPGLLAVDDEDRDSGAAPAAVTVRIDPEVSWAEYALWLEAVTRLHPEKFLRTKGTVRTPSGPLIVQSVGSTIARPQHTTTATDTTMVLIYCGIERERVLRSLQTFVAGVSVVDRVELTPC
ncbi:GTP-binding protein [Rhodococcus sp. T2V]|uniref:CobW family GTP-binding protein n=1 Tax=Rhodococcus sp. T2V TaxID=3034164 RepID=UPI0023E2757E|nr:GTP-binding protein [Rhodococcus sp. T2V]MDF3308139.1 GTP-binding protein [Rhodococcus sp. T2V]